MLLQDAISQVKVDLPKEFLFAIIALLLGFIGWVGIKYYNRLETILSRLEQAIEAQNVMNALFKSEQSTVKLEQEALKNRVTKLEDSNKRRR